MEKKTIGIAGAKSVDVNNSGNDKSRLVDYTVGGWSITSILCYFKSFVHIEIFIF